MEEFKLSKQAGFCSLFDKWNVKFSSVLLRGVFAEPEVFWQTILCFIQFFDILFRDVLELCVDFHLAGAFYMNKTTLFLSHFISVLGVLTSKISLFVYTSSHFFLLHDAVASALPLQKTHFARMSPASKQPSSLLYCFLIFYHFFCISHKILSAFTFTPRLEDRDINSSTNHCIALLVTNPINGTSPQQLLS